ncbi:flagellar filament capping protein FliD [Crenobacter caeni]|nr:flagellar filament capping protein FliD [Crenobacter caeni]
MFDPNMMATQMAQIFVQKPQQAVDMKSAQLKARRDALNDLQKSMQAFKTSLGDLTRKKSMVAMGASFSKEGVGSVTATGQAQPGSYSLFVKQVATAHQVSYGQLAGSDAAGKLTVGQGSETFDVDLSAADNDKDGVLSVQEMALAINRAEGNAGKVSAMVVSVGGEDQLVLSSGKTGEKHAVTLSASDNPVLAGKLADAANFKELNRAQDAIVMLGGETTGVEIRQDSNKFTAIQGVTMTFTQAMKPGETLQLDVTRNQDDTKGNVQAFVDAFNTLVKKLDEITASGNAESGKKAGPLANDSAIRALRSKLNELTRGVYDGVKLADLGLSASRDGSLQLDADKLEKALAKDPSVLDRYFGGTDGKSGSLSKLTDYMDTWLKSTDGLIKRRKDSEDAQQKTLDKRQDAIDRQYDQAFQRYLKQYTQLQAMQVQMSRTLEMMNGYFA